MLKSTKKKHIFLFELNILRISLDFVYSSLFFLVPKVFAVLYLFSSSSSSFDEHAHVPMQKISYSNVNR